VFALHNAVDMPALLPDGSPSELSVSSMLVRRDLGDDGPAALPPVPDEPEYDNPSGRADGSVADNAEPAGQAEPAGASTQGGADS
jgi:NADH-quinone oxidoreductase subunit J